MRFKLWQVLQDPIYGFYLATGKRPYDYQVEWMRNKAHHKWAVKSRQTGFSFLNAYELLVENLQALWNNIYIATSKRVTSQARQKTRVMINRIGAQDEIERDTEEMIIFKNGTIANFLPSASASSLGLEGKVRIDEAAHMTEPDELLRVVVPMTSRGYPLNLFSTPFGHDKLFWAKGQSDNYTKWDIPWERCPDLCLPDHDRPHLKRIDAIREDLPDDIFQQEYCCAFLDESVAFFPHSLILANQKGALDMPYLEITEIGGARPSDEIIAKLQVVMDEMRRAKPWQAGMDVGRSTDNSEIIWCRKENNLILPCGNLSMKNMSMVVQEWVVRQVAGMCHVNIDRGLFGVSILDHAIDAGNARGFQMNPAEKARLVENLKLLLDKKDRLRLPESRQLINQLVSVRRVIAANVFRYESTQSRKVSHLDKVMALALAVYEEESSAIQISFGNW